MKTNKQAFAPGSVVKIVGATPMNVFDVGTYQLLIDVNCDGTVTTMTDKGVLVVVDGTSCELAEPYGKSTLKRFIKYLILYWINKKIKAEELELKGEFYGIELAKFVKAKINRPKMYNPTVFRYMNDMNTQLGFYVYSTVRSESKYCLVYFSTLELQDWYN